MFRKAILIVLTLACFSGMAIAEEPGVFLPFYFLYGNVTNPLSPLTVDGHQVVYFQGHPITSVIAPVAANKYLMNIMRARYFSKFSVAPGGTYQVGVAKGTDSYGKDPVSYVVSGQGADQLDFVLAWNEGAGLLPPAGTVPLTINRSTVGSDIKLSWASTYPTNIDIYYQVADSYDRAGTWTLIGAGFDESGRSSRYVKHTSQVGTGDRAVFYKALEPGRPTSLLADAWAAGKYNVDVRGTQKYTFFGLPFIPRTADVDSVIGAQLEPATSAGNVATASEIWAWENNPAIPVNRGAFTAKMYRNTTGWAVIPGAREFMFKPGDGYFIYSKSTHADDVITLVGDISPVSVARETKVGEYMYSFISNPFPISLAPGNADLTGAHSGAAAGSADQIWSWSLASQGFVDKSFLNSGTWTAFGGTGVAALLPGRGFIYNRTAAAPAGGFNWGLDPYR